jgi:hypothetical protein
MAPPRWAYALLKSLLRPSDAESVPGDLLEEYREVKRPALGRRRADAWYIKQVLSVLGFTMFLIYGAITRPILLLAPFENPFIFVIMTVLLAIAAGFGIVAGMAGAAAGRWLPPSRSRAHLS